jgi:uridine kinase
MAQTQRSLVVLIGGGSASGKTRLARHLRDALGRHRAVMIEEDAYYHPAEVRGPGDTRTYNFDEPHTKDFALIHAHLTEARAGRAFDLPHYDFSLHDRTAQTTRIEPMPVLILEGMHCLGDAAVLALGDLTVFVESDAATRRARRIARDVAERGRGAEDTARQFDAIVEPMHRLHVERLKPFAQRIVVNHGDATVLHEAALRLAAEITGSLLLPRPAS